MVIGNGSIANIFIKKYSEDKDILIFASGVSDSNETDDNKFKREEDLIINSIEENKDVKIVYFSSIFVNHIDNKYYNHKLKIESIIEKYSTNYLILRLPQIISFSGNKNNLINYFYNSIKNNYEIKIYENTFRCLIDIDDVFKITNYVINKINLKILNFSKIEKINVIDLCYKISDILGVTPKIKIEKKINEIPDIENDVLINEAIVNCGINKINYINNVLNKYIKKW